MNINTFQIKTYYLLVFALFYSHTIISGQENSNLFSNGKVENVISTLFVQDKGYNSHIETEEARIPPFWRLSDGAVLCEDGYSGGNAICMSCREDEVTSTIFSDSWKVEDANIPFGLPLVPGKEITVSFRYKTTGLKGTKTFTALVKLGVIEKLGAKEMSLDLPASEEWKLVTRKIDLSKLKWGCEITFTLPGDKSKKGKVWIDDVYLAQQLEGVNLIKNHSFEDCGSSMTIPKDWQIPIEDQWVSWVGARYRKPVVDTCESFSGHQSLRADVVYADGSGVAQKIILNQHEIKPIVIELWSKLNNEIVSKTGYPLRQDTYSNVTVYVYHHDGTMQEVSPMLNLGMSDHDWDFRRLGFMPQKPVKALIVQVTVLGTEHTTSLWIDEVKVYELGTGIKELTDRGVDLPPLSISSKWGSKCTSTTGKEIRVSNDDKNLYLTIPDKDSEEISIYLNPNTQSAFVNHFRYLFDVIKIATDGKVYKGSTVEKQGYTADGLFKLAKEYGIESQKSGKEYHITVPFKTLGMKGISFRPFGFNVMWKKGDQKDFWNGKSANNMEMGRIILSKTPGVRVKSLQFGQRYYIDKGGLHDFISQPPIYAGTNEAVITLTNEGADCQIELTAGMQNEQKAKKTVRLNSHEVKRVIIDYQTGLERLTAFNLKLYVDGKQKINQSYPILVPPPAEIKLDQEFYYPEEDSAFIEINNRYRPIPSDGKVEIEMTDLMNNKIIKSFTRNFTDTIGIIPIAIHNLRINPLPVQDYSITVKYLNNDNKLLGKQTKRFGRINHTERRKLPPIEKIKIDDEGRVIINDNFRFFPVLVSDHIKEWGAGIDMGANVRKGRYVIDDSTDYKERDKAWEENAYTLFIGPYTPEEFEHYKSEAENLIVHPGVLSTYSHQFYYWKLSDEWINFRKEVESFMRTLSSPRLIIWGHHDSSFLYDRDLPKWPNDNNPSVGYCYVKIMGRPGSAWRNTPFLTKTEQVLEPSRFKMAEVNYYVSGHYDEVLPLNFVCNLSLRGDDWHGLRNESYLSIIYGADALYHWIIMQDKKVQRLRGWFQETNFMWPIFVADDAENKIDILPYGSKLDARLKKWQGKYYLIVANRDETFKEASISIDGFKGMKVKKLFELPGKMSIDDNTIQDTWEKYDVHVYEIEE